MQRCIASNNRKNAKIKNLTIDCYGCKICNKRKEKASETKMRQQKQKKFPQGILICRFLHCKWRHKIESDIKKKALLVA